MTAMHHSRTRAPSLYETDFYGWTQEQSSHLKARRFDAIDLQNIVEEIETLGRSEASALESAMRLICMHQLKRMFQAERAESRSWTNTIIRERNHAARLIRDNPGLKSKLDQLFVEAYADARREAAGETAMALALFPVDPPFSLEAVLDHAYWADAVSP